MPAAISGRLFAGLWRTERLLLALAAILRVAPDWTVTVLGLAIAAPVVIRQGLAVRREA